MDDFRLRVNSIETIEAAQQAFRARQIDLYDGEIAYVDEQFGRLVEALKRLDQYEDTCIVFVSDHGEEFWEHGATNHGHSLYDELLRVPCIVKLPGGKFAGARVTDVIEMVDIAPTVLDVLDLDSDPRFQGRSVRGLWSGEPASGQRSAFSRLLVEHRDMSATRTSSSKFIWNIADDSTEGFDLRADPFEQSPLSADSLPELEDATRTTTLQDAAGLHVFVPRLALEALPLSCMVEGTLGERRVLVHPPGAVQISQVGNIVRFEVPRPRDDSSDNLGSVHIVIDLGVETMFKLRLDREGEPLRQDRVGAGTDDQYPFAESGEVLLESLLVHPGDMVLDDNSRKVRVWYLPNSTIIKLTEVGKDTADALRALGYLK